MIGINTAVVDTVGVTMHVRTAYLNAEIVDDMLRLDEDHSDPPTDYRNLRSTRR